MIDASVCDKMFHCSRVTLSISGKRYGSLTCICRGVRETWFVGEQTCGGMEKGGLAE